MFSIKGREGGVGLEVWGVRFCSVEKGGLFSAEQSAILTGGGCALSERLDTGALWDERRERRLLSVVDPRPRGAAAPSQCEKVSPTDTHLKAGAARIHSGTNTVTAWKQKKTCAASLLQC